MPLTAYERVKLARGNTRPTGIDFIQNLFSDFFELHGDRRCGDDSAIVAGIARLNGQPVTVIAIEKGHTARERAFRSFGEISHLSSRAANVFADAGVQRGDRVMVLLKRHYEYWICAIALHKLGAVPIPATHMLTVSDLSYRLRSADVKAIICTPHNGVPEKIQKTLCETGWAKAFLPCPRSSTQLPPVRPLHRRSSMNSRV